MRKMTFMKFCALLGLAAVLSLSSGGMLRSARVLFAFVDDGTAAAQDKGMLKVIFKVKCYDEGKAALQGLNGIYKIETGFHYLHETDTVYFDPKAVTIEEMESALKNAGTYVETIKEKERN